ESDAGDQVVSVLRKHPQRGLDRSRITRFDVAQDNREVLLRAQYADIRRGVERTVVLAADVKDDSDFLFSGVSLGDKIARGATGKRQRTKDKQNQDGYFHVSKSIRSSNVHYNSLPASSGHRLIASLNVGSPCSLLKMLSRSPTSGFKLSSVSLRSLS